MKRVRLLAAALVLSAVIAAVGWIPLPHHVMASVEMEPHDAERIYITTAGVLENVEPFSYDRPIKPGHTLARLKNEHVETEILQLRGEQLRQQKRLENLEDRQGDPAVDRQIPSAQKALEDLTARLRHREEDRRRLTLRASRAGYVIPPPSRPPSPLSPGELGRWARTPFAPENAGCFLETGELFCLIGDPQKMDAVLVAEQSDMDWVREGQAVKIQLDEYPGEILRGRVAEIAKLDLQVAPRGLGGSAGGPLSTRTDAAGVERPTTASYQIRVALEASPVRLLSGFRGQAKIRTAPQTLGKRLWRYLQEVFYFQW